MNICLFALAAKCDLYDGWEPDRECISEGGKGCAEFERLMLPKILGNMKSPLDKNLPNGNLAFCDTFPNFLGKVNLTISAKNCTYGEKVKGAV